MLTGGDYSVVHVSVSDAVKMNEPLLDGLLQLLDTVFVVAEPVIDYGLTQRVENDLRRLVFCKTAVRIAENFIQRRRLGKAKSNCHASNSSSSSSSDDNHKRLIKDRHLHTPT